MRMRLLATSDAADGGRRLTAAAVLLALVASGAGAEERAAGIISLVKAGDAGAVRARLAADAGIAHVAEVDGTTALQWAAHLDEEGTVAALLAAGADP